MNRKLGMLAVAALAIPAALAGTPETAEAHVCMDFPISRTGPECTFRSPQKIGTCGVAERSEFINVFRPGETIVVRIRETIDHPSHYRIAFNPDGDAFPDPVAIDDINEDHPLILVDGIEDAEEREQEVEITFPNTPCENCTLQLIQVMYDKQQNGFGGANGSEDDNDDLYYSCADIVLRGEPVADASSTGGGDRNLALPLAGILVVGLAGASLNRSRRRD